MSTVNISFNDDLLKQIDLVAGEESRSRSELIREAARSYIERKRRWGGIFKIGLMTAQSKDVKPGDIEAEIASFRKGKRK
jgi:CopG family transcriptional regulator / antitoxin EndoAI